MTRITKKAVNRIKSGKVILTGEPLGSALQNQMSSPDPTDFLPVGKAKGIVNLLSKVK